MVLAVARVESANDMEAFLFEPHVFSKITQHKYDRMHPAISYPTWDRTKYPKTRNGRMAQFGEATGLEPLKAYEAASWGLFQIMGYHFKVLKYTSAVSMASNLKVDLAANVTAFGRIVKEMGIVETLRDKQFSKFARAYNGPGYKLNSYDLKMEAEYYNLMRLNGHNQAHQ